MAFRMTTPFCMDKLSAGNPSAFQRSISLSLLMKRQKSYSWSHGGSSRTCLGVDMQRTDIGNLIGNCSQSGRDGTCLYGSSSRTCLGVGMQSTDIKHWITHTSSNHNEVLNTKPAYVCLWLLHPPLLYCCNESNQTSESLQLKHCTAEPTCTPSCCIHPFSTRARTSSE